MPFVVRGEVSGLRQTLRRLGDVDKKVRKKIVRKAVRAGGKVILKRAKALVPQDSGWLRKSLWTKVKLFRSGRAVAIVGARTHRKEAVTDKRGHPRVEDPSKIAHLAEGGRKAVAVKTKQVLSDGSVVYGKRVKEAKGSHFMERTLQSAGSAAQEAMKAVIETELRSV